MSTAVIAGPLSVCAASLFAVPTSGATCIRCAPSSSMQSQILSTTHLASRGADLIAIRPPVRILVHDDAMRVDQPQPIRPLVLQYGGRPHVLQAGCLERRRRIAREARASERIPGLRALD